MNARQRRQQKRRKATDPSIHTIAHLILPHLITGKACTIRYTVDYLSRPLHLAKET